MFWKKRNLDEIVVFAITLIIKIIYSILGADISLISDHLGQIAIAAEVAGNDWSSLVAGETSYYGWGFNWLFAVVLKCTDNPYVLYGIISVVFSFVIAMGSCFLYKAAKYFDANHHGMYALLVIGLGITTATGYGSTPILYILNSIIVYVGIKLFDGDRKLGWSILFAFLVVYSVSIHQKNVLVVCSASFCVLFAIILCKRKREYIQSVCAPYFATVGLLYFVFIRLKGVVIANVWASIDGQIKNSTILRGDMFWFTKDIVEAIDLFFQCFFSNIYTLCNNTYGIGAVIIVVFMFVIIEMLIVLCKRKQDLTFENICLKALIIGVGLVTFLIMAGLAFDGARGVFSGNNNNYVNWTYHRYYISYAQVLTVLVLCYFFRQVHRNQIVILLCSAGVYLASYLYFQLVTIPTLSMAQEVAERNIKWYLAWFVDFGDSAINAKVSAVLFVCMFIVLLKKKREVVIGAVCLVISVIKIGGIPDMQFPMSTTCGAVYELYKNIGMEELPAKIYTDSNRRFTLQFMLNRKSVVRGFPEEEGIYFSHKKNVKTPEGYVRIQLDSDEYIYVKGLELQEKIYAILE